MTLPEPLVTMTSATARLRCPETNKAYSDIEWFAEKINFVRNVWVNFMTEKQMIRNKDGGSGPLVFENVQIAVRRMNWKPQE